MNVKYLIIRLGHCRLPMNLQVGLEYSIAKSLQGVSEKIHDMCSKYNKFPPSESSEAKILEFLDGGTPVLIPSINVCVTPLPEEEITNGF